MKVSPNVLVVEGHSDKRFMLGLQRHIGLTDVFEVRYPGESSRRPGKSGAIRQFSVWLEEAAEPGRYSAVGACLDADNLPDGGFGSTDSELKDVLARTGFRLVDALKRIYVHSVSKCRASYWIAPDHASEGYAETMLLSSLTSDESKYCDATVVPFLRGLTAARFDVNNFDRAVLYSYLAIQRKPDKSVPTLMDDGLVDINTGSIAELGKWLRNLCER